MENWRVVLTKGTTPLKAILDNEMKRMILSNKTHSIHDRRFLKPIAPKNTRLNLLMNYLLCYFWKYPNDQVPGV